MEGGSFCLEKKEYKCGGCFFFCTTIIDLHLHLTDHIEGGNYFYNSLLKTAYPKYSFTEVDCQTDAPVEESALGNISVYKSECFTVDRTSSDTSIPYTTSRATQTDDIDFSIVKIENLEQVDNNYLEVERDIKEYCNEQSIKQSPDTKVYENSLLQAFDNSDEFTDEADVAETVAEPTDLHSMWTGFNNESQMSIDTGSTICATTMEYKDGAGVPADLKPANHNIDAGISVKADSKINDINAKVVTNGKLKVKNKGKRDCREQRFEKREILRNRHKGNYKGNLNWGSTKSVKTPLKKLKIKVNGGKKSKEYVQVSPNANATILSDRSVKSENGAIESDNDLVESIQEHTDWSEKKSYLCAICNKILKTKPYWEQHIERLHYHSYTLQCEKCFCPHQDEDEMRSHNCSLAASGLHECLQCEDKKNFRFFSNLFKHVKVKHGGKYPLKCERCRILLLSELEKRKHMIKHDPTLLTCMYCEKHLKSIFDLDSHMAKHTGETKFHCHLCEKKYRKKCYLRDHLVSIHGIGAKQFMCEKCGMSFSCSKLLSSHRRSTCGEPPFECGHCGKIFRQKTSLIYHKRTHSGDRPFVCDMCGDSFTHSNTLKNHVKHKHTNEREFKCSMCDKAFVKICTLQRHERVHLKIRPYVCEFCKKEFSTRWNLKAHLRQHTGDTPYTCAVCGLGFAHNVVRKTHEAKCMRNSL